MPTRSDTRKAKHTLVVENPRTDVMTCYLQTSHDIASGKFGATMCTKNVNDGFLGKASSKTQLTFTSVLFLAVLEAVTNNGSNYR